MCRLSPGLETPGSVVLVELDTNVNDLVDDHVHVDCTSAEALAADREAS
jgi:hypothetical protein